MMIMLVYKSSDQELLKTSHPTTTVTVTSNPDSGSLSTGDKAGIGVGIVAAVLLIAASILAWMLLRRVTKASMLWTTTDILNTIPIRGSQQKKSEASR